MNVVIVRAGKGPDTFSHTSDIKNSKVKQWQKGFNYMWTYPGANNIKSKGTYIMLMNKGCCAVAVSERPDYPGRRHVRCVR